MHLDLTPSIAPTDMPDEITEVIPEADRDDMEAEKASGRYQLKKLKTKHKQVLSLIAQGEPRWKVATLCEITPDYVTMLCAMPICQEYLADMTKAAGIQLEAMFVKSVDVISDALHNGDTGDQLKAARLQLEATKRIGRPSDAVPTNTNSEERLLRLAERLTALIPARQQVILDAQFEEVKDGSQAGI